MRSIIVCEGKTDAILLSYYLSRVKNWTHVKKDKFKKNGLIELPVQNADNESANWYQIENDFLAIWGVGSNSCFDYAIGEIIELNKLLPGNQSFQKIILLIDRDKAIDDKTILSQFIDSFKKRGLNIEVEVCKWKPIQIVNDFSETITSNVTSIIIPFDKNGALETFLLDAISEQLIDKHVVDSCRAFISSFNSEKYLTTERLRLKAELATTFAILSPQKVFSFLDELLLSIKWEDYKLVQSCFQILEEI